MRGEFVIVIAPPAEAAAPDADDVDALIRAALARVSVKDAVGEIVAATGLPRRDVYQRALELAKERTMPRRKPGKSDKPAPSPERQVAFKLGLSAEGRAAALLLAKGFRIVARRFRSPVGEIDIVARRGALLIFVEVKARRALDDAAWAVTQRQKRRISISRRCLARRASGRCDVRHAFRCSAGRAAILAAAYQGCVRGGVASVIRAGAARHHAARSRSKN